MAPTRKERNNNIAIMRKEQILSAAFIVFSEKGFAEATIAEISQTAGVAEGTIYKYFQNKRELMVAVIKNFAITDRFLSLFEHAGETDFPSFITAVLENRIGLVGEAGKEQPLLLMGDLLRDPELKGIFNQQVIKPLMTMMEKFYQEGADKGYFRPLDTSVITRTMGGLVIGLLILMLLEGESSPLQSMPRQKLAGEIVQIVLAGIKNE